MESKQMSTAAAPPACDWSGFYIGGNVGITEYYFRSTDESDFYDIFTRDRDTGAFIGGGQIGYNFQFGDIVLGLEADASGSNAEISKTYDSGDWHSYGKVDFMTTLRARAGISMDGNKVLLYATGGGAYAHGKWDEYYNQPGDYSYADWRGDDWRWGWTAGAGLEYMLNCHWTLRGEVLLTWLTEDSKPITSSGPGYAGEDYKIVFSDDLYTFRFGVNYKFGSFFGR